MGVGRRLGHGADAVVEVGGGGGRAEGPGRGVIVRRASVRPRSTASKLRQQLMFVLYTPFARPQLKHTESQL